MTQERNEYICCQCHGICVKGDPSIIRAVGKIYHKQCFQCNFCHISILDKFYVLDDNNSVVCENDYYSTVQFQCQQCKEPIVNDHFELIGDNKYHKYCLHCPDCIETPQNDLERFEYDGKPYCRFHYSLLKGTACVGCTQAILYQYKWKHGQKWHPECYMIKKYWDIDLSYKINYKNKEHMLSVQDHLLAKRERIWNVTSQFQESIANTLNNIIHSNQLFDHKKEYECCHRLLQLVQSLFHSLDDQSAYLSCQDPIQTISKDIIALFNILCRQQELENAINIANRLSYHTRDLLKFSLQQAIILEREENTLLVSLLDTLSTVFTKEREYKSSYIQEYVQLIQMALIRLGFSLKSKPHQEGIHQLHELVYTDPLYKQFSSQDDMQPLDRIKRILTVTTSHESNPPCEEEEQQQWPSFMPELSPQQDNTIRHLSLLYLNNMDESIMEELLDYKRDSIWGKLKTHMNRNSLSPSMQTTMVDADRKIIGVSLSNLSNGSLSQSTAVVAVSNTSFENWVTCCPSIQACFSPQSLLPSFLRDCILVLVDQDLNTEGLFRKNGNIRGLRDMCDMINASSPGREDWTHYFKEHTNIQLAAFVKKFLRELPEPLLTKRLYKLFMLANRATHTHESVAMIHYTLCLLPKQNRDILFLILALLHWVARHAEKNKMDHHNLAKVIAPAILYHHQQEQQCDCLGEINVVSLMIQYYERLIKVPTKLGELVKNAKLIGYVQENEIDLTSTKQFIRNYRQLLKIKRDNNNSMILSPTTCI